MKIKFIFSQPEVVANVVLQPFWISLANDCLQVGVLQGVPDGRIRVLFQRVEITAQGAGKQNRFLYINVRLTKFY